MSVGAESHGRNLLAEVTAVAAYCCYCDRKEHPPRRTGVVGVRACPETTEVDRAADNTDHPVDTTILPVFDVSDSETERLNMIGEEGQMK